MSKTILESSPAAEAEASGKRAPSFHRALWYCHHGEWFGCLNQLDALKRGKKTEDLPDLFLSYYGLSLIHI